MYPYPGYPYAGIFNERCVAALKQCCDQVEVLSPRPYVPPLLSFVPRWKTYATAVKYEVRGGVSIHRPATPVIPRLGTALWWDIAPFLWCRATAKKMHRHVNFDAILSFDLLGAGGMAWRVGRELSIPAAGWAFGSDVRSPKSSALGRVVARALQHLDLVFYQSHELLENAAQLLEVAADRISHGRHVVLPHGIPEPPSTRTHEVRRQIRTELGINDNQLMVLSLGRIVRSKGIFELLEAFSLAAAKDPRLVAVIVGSTPTFDETAVVREKIAQTPGLGQRVILLSSCNPAKVWEYLCAADIFAFTSHQEGMPNSLLEAMAMGVPAVAFAIPPVHEIDEDSGALVAVPPLDFASFAAALLRLAGSADERFRLAQKGKAQVMERFMVRKNMAKAVQYIACVVKQPRSQS